jgi:hypothetical protein
LEIRFSKTAANTYNGYALIKVNAFDATMPANEFLRIEFNTTDAAVGRQMRLRLVESFENPSASGMPQKLLLDLVEKDGVITLQGATYHPSVNPKSGASTWCYVLRGKISVAEDKAIVQIALPSASYADSATLFDSCGAYTVVRKWVCARMDSLIATQASGSLPAIVYASAKYDKKIPSDNIIHAADSTADTLTYLTVENIMPYLVPGTVDSITDTHILAFLQLNQHIAAWGQKWGYLVQTVQPVYYSGAAGYAANGATPPAGFPFTASDAQALGFFMPATATALTVGFTDTSGPPF